MKDFTSPPETHRILVVDDTASIHEDFRKILMPSPDRHAGIDDFASAIFGVKEKPQTRPVFSVDSAMQGEAGLAMVQEAQAQERPYALAFVDMRMPPGWDGITTIRHLWNADPFLQIVICTAHSDTSWDEAFRALGQSDNLLVLKKPFDSIEALQLASALTRKWTTARQNRDRLALLDGTVRQRTSELRIAQERFSQAFSASPLPQAIQDLGTGRFVEINAAFEKLCGQTRIQFLDEKPAATNAVTPFAEFRRNSHLLNRLRAGEAIDDYAFTLPREGGGGPREMRGSGRVVSIADRPSAVWVFRDITEQIQLEQQFRQGQKMEAVGQLAAGIAHDFNNLLTVILSYSSFVLDDATLAADHRSGLGQVCAAAQRAAALTRQLLVFSRRQIAMPEPIDIGYTLENLRDMLRRLLPERIKLEWTCREQLPRVLADAANLEQIVINLIVNARDAIADSGTIRLDVQTVTLSEEDLRKSATGRPGEFVRLSVSDDGKGMDPSIVARIFEPFFTTKEIGQGTGLGLSTVYALVQQHGGWLHVESVPNEGTTFEIFLPALTELVEAESSPPPPIEPAIPDGGGESVLLVEDEPFLRETTALVAARAGYVITQAADGPAALQAWSEASRPFDLLLTDLVMPNGLSGIQLAAQLRAKHPALRVIFSTGYNDELLRSGASAIEGTHLLLKPYTSSELIEMLHQALRLTGRRSTVSPFNSRPPIPPETKTSGT